MNVSDARNFLNYASSSDSEENQSDRPSDMEESSSDMEESSSSFDKTRVKRQLVDRLITHLLKYSARERLEKVNRNRGLGYHTDTVKAILEVINRVKLMLNLLYLSFLSVKNLILL
jgi:hypothetical protein